MAASPSTYRFDFWRRASLWTFLFLLGGIEGCSSGQKNNFEATRKEFHPTEHTYGHPASEESRSPTEISGNQSAGQVQLMSGEFPAQKAAAEAGKQSVILSADGMETEVEDQNPKRDAAEMRSLPAIPEAHKKAQTQEANSPVLPLDAAEIAPMAIPLVTDKKRANAEKKTKSAQSQGANKLSLVDVVASVHDAYPLIQAAYLENMVAEGKELAAWGAYDLKLKAASENNLMGYYKTYRQSVGLAQPLYNGGEVFGGYRIGRGSFPPWYQERQTNDGGEFKAGFVMPLLKNREIDQRRAQLWRAQYDRQMADPEIRAQLLEYVQDGSKAYWQWIAAGRKLEISQTALAIAQDRNEQLSRRVEVGDVDPPVLQDNLRTIAEREASLITRERSLNQSAVNLSLFYRSAETLPVVPERTMLADFPEPVRIDPLRQQTDMAIAVERRPEMLSLTLQRKKMLVDQAEAMNELNPTLDAQFVGSQDVGEPTSSKRDKSPFELEANVFLEVPLQRRKAQGSITAIEAKLGQLAQKTKFMQESIQADVQYTYAALTAAYQRVEKAREAVRLAEYIAEVERRKFELGESDLLAVFLREQNAIEAADAEVDALLEYYLSKADYHAVLAMDWPE